MEKIVMENMVQYMLIRDVVHCIFYDPIHITVANIFIALKLTKMSYKRRNKMDEIELVQKIGDQVCEDYDPFADCGIDPI